MDDDLVDIEDIYRLVNKVQVQGRKVVFVVRDIDKLIVENILKDSEIIFTCLETHSTIEFKLFPNKVEQEKEFSVDKFWDQIKRKGIF